MRSAYTPVLSHTSSIGHLIPLFSTLPTVSHWCVNVCVGEGVQ